MKKKLSPQGNFPNALIVCAIIFGFALLISFFLDAPAFEAVTKIKNPLFDHLMSWLSIQVFLIAVLILITLFFLAKKKGNESIMALWLSFFFSWILSYILKFLIARPRIIEQTILNLPDYSFPSSHAAIAFSLLPLLGREFPKLRWFWLLFVLSIAFSRIYLKAHHLSDVVGGAILGYSIGFLVIRHIEKGKNVS